MSTSPLPPQEMKHPKNSKHLLRTGQSTTRTSTGIIFTREQLVSNTYKGELSLVLNLDDLISYDNKLSSMLLEQPLEMIPIVQS